MTPEIDRSMPPAERNLRVESLPFSQIPGQSKLFIDYQSDATKLRQYYPSAVGSHTEIADRIPDVLDNYHVDRDVLCDILDEQNRRFGSSVKTFENIELLRRPKTVSVLTGQQAGLFTGPLYTIYKALSAVRMTACLRNRGFDAVPVFWAATEDHDFAEVSNAFVIGTDGEVAESKVNFGPKIDGLSVGNILTGTGISETIDEFFTQLPATEFSQQLRAELTDAYVAGTGFGDGFSKLVAKLLGAYGIITIDPLDPRLKDLAKPVYAAAASASDEIARSLVERSRELEAAGYHAQVLVNDDYFPLFWHDEKGARKSMRRTPKGRIRVAGERTEFTIEELCKNIADQPGRFSPNVMLRPVVQDYLLPTVCYFGGGAEIAYFAQNSEVYRILDRSVTPILHRQSFTVVEAKHARTLDKYGLKFADLFEGSENLLGEIVSRFLNPATAKLFANVEEEVNTELNRLDQDLSGIDPTLSENLAKRRRKILYHIGAMYKKFQRVQMVRDEDANRKLNAAFNSLLPKGGLQERTLNAVSFLDRYGSYFIDWVYDSIDLDDKGHRIIYL